LGAAPWGDLVASATDRSLISPLTFPFADQLQNDRIAVAALNFAEHINGQDHNKKQKSVFS